METRLRLRDGRKCRPPFYETGRSPLYTLELFVTSAGMNLCPIEGTEIKVARTAPAKHKADFALIFYTIKETKSMDILRSRVPLPLPTFPDRCLMQLPMVSSHPLMR